MGQEGNHFHIQPIPQHQQGWENSNENNIDSYIYPDNGLRNPYLGDNRVPRKYQRKW